MTTNLAGLSAQLPGPATYDPLAANEVLPVMRPRLPTYDQLEPYLRRIDHNRTYTNRGPLVAEFEARLDRQFGLAGAAVSANSGTSALIAAIYGVAGRASAARPLAIMPSFTFVATALAAEMCGYEPYVVDVEPATWMLDPDAILAHPALARAGVVVCVAPFGRAFRAAPWERVRERTGVPVIFDAAASFDVLSETGRAKAAFGTLPVALSFHATKSFSTGEGGAVICTDPSLLLKISRSLNLGFAGSRDCAAPALNGKLSEYHAAVGLAEFDTLGAKRVSAARVAAAYRVAAARLGIPSAFYTAPTISGCYVLVDAGSPARANAVARALTAARIGSRFWYGRGIAGHEHFANVARDATPVADDTAGRILGLPVAADLDEGAIETIAGIVATGLNE